MIKGGQQLDILSGKRALAKEGAVGAGAAAIRKQLGTNLPRVALVLGSGFQKVLQSVKIHAELNITDIPGFPRMRVAGHSGKIVTAELAGLPVVVVSGRAHYYEGHSMEAVMFPVRLLGACGVEKLLLTNAAGGINPEYRPGDFMAFADHINLMGVNPLRGLPVEDGRCFVDLSDTYCAHLRQTLRHSAQGSGVRLHEGVYIGVSGPTYETPAEIRAFAQWGADAVGMSTIPEALMARYLGMRVLALSCITNSAAGLGVGKLSHQEVLDAGEANAANALRLLEGFGRILRTGAAA